MKFQVLLDVITMSTGKE